MTGLADPEGNEADLAIWGQDAPRFRSCSLATRHPVVTDVVIDDRGTGPAAYARATVDVIQRARDIAGPA